MSSPKNLEDFSHLFFSNAREKNEASQHASSSHASSQHASSSHASSSHASSQHASSPHAPSSPEIHGRRSSKRDDHELFDPDILKRMLNESEVALDLFGGALLVDGEAVEPDGVDLIFADGEGNPVLLEILRGTTEIIPFRIFNHLDILQRNAGLFLRAYGRRGILNVGDPLFLFVAPSFPDEVVRAVQWIGSVRVRFLAARIMQVEGTRGLLLLEVYPIRNGTGPSLFIPIPTL